MFNNSEAITSLVVTITVIVTLLSWYNPEWQAFFMGYPYKSYHFGEWYRLFTQGLIHASMPHLVLNMYTLYSFGSLVEGIYSYHWGAKGVVLYFLLYIGGIISAGVGDVWVHANNFYYQSLGASAGVAAIMLSAVLFNPFNKVLVYGLIPMPSWLYAMGYLLLSYYMIGSRSGINHLAHLLGSLYGVVFTLIFNPDLAIAYFEFFKKYLNL